MKIEIGGGIRKRGGEYKSCDIRNIPGVDYVCPANDLPFENESIDEIYSRHLVEHFTLKEFLEILTEWNRVLKTGGTLYIIVPNLLFHLEQVLKGSHKSLYKKASGQNDRYWGFGSLFGWQQDEYDVHKFGYYFELLKDILENAGFSKIQDLTNSPQGIEKAPHHLEVKAEKIIDFKEVTSHPLYNLFDVKH